MCLSASSISFSYPTQAHSAVQAGATAPAIPDFSAEPIVIEEQTHLYKMEADGTGVITVTLRAKVQSEAAVRQLGQVILPFASRYQHIELDYLRVRHKDGSVSETQADDAIEMPAPVTTQSPLYSDLKYLQIPVRSLRVGDQLEWQERLICTKAMAPGNLWGEEQKIKSGIVLKQNLVLDLPDSLPIVLWNPGNKPEITHSAGRTLYRWSFANLEPTVGPAADAAKEAKKHKVLSADEELDAREGELPTIAWSSFANWESLGSWYQKLSADRADSNNPAIQKKAAELTADKSSDEEKLRAIYSYVSTQIRYIGVDFGIGRFQPHLASETLENQFGDCKDKQTLIAALLKAIGISSDAVFAGSGLRFNPSLAMPLEINHVFSHLTLQGKEYWFDATPEVAPFGMLLSTVRDKQVLVIPPTGAVHVERTPPDLPYPAIDQMRSVASIDPNGIIHAHIEIRTRSDSEWALRSLFHQTTSTQYDQALSRFLQGLGYAGTGSHLDISLPEETSEPFRMSFDYMREKPGNWDARQIVAELLPVSLPRIQESDPPVAAIELGAKRKESSHAEMTLPEGWTATLPDDLHLKTPWVNYDRSYKFVNGIVVADRTIETLVDRVPQADWREYLKFADQADLGNEPYINLHAGKALAKDDSKPADKPITIVGTKSESPNQSPQMRAALLVDQAVRLLTKKDLSRNQMELVEDSPDLKQVASLLDEAKALDPKAQRLWFAYGELKETSGKVRDGIEFYEKELKLFPDHTIAFPPLIWAYEILGQYPQAEDAAKRWCTVQTDIDMPWMRLVNVYLDAGEGQKANEALGHLLELFPKEQGNLETTIARAQVAFAMGANKGGEEVLLQMLRHSTDPSEMNDLAFELAVRNLDLDEAHSALVKAAEMLEKNGQQWHLAEDSTPGLNETGTMIAIFDSLGWVEFLQGNKARAWDLIHAAWLNEPELEVGFHLGQIAEANGQDQQALFHYKMAIDTQPKYRRLGTRKNLSATDKKLLAAVAGLEQRGVKIDEQKAEQQVAAMQRIPIPFAPGKPVEAEYRLLMSKDGIVDLRWLSGDLAPKADEAIKLAKLADFFPKDSKARLLRDAYLHCTNAGCFLQFK